MAEEIRKGFKDKDGRKVRLEGVPDNNKADKVQNATAGNFACLDSNGNMTDSGKNAGDFATANHKHSFIQTEEARAEVRCSTVGNTDNGKINLYVEDAEGNSHSADITPTNIANLNRALNNPSSEPENDSAKLITSKAVFDALSDKVKKNGSTLLGNLAIFGPNNTIIDSHKSTSDFAPATGSTEYATANHNHDNAYAPKLVADLINGTPNTYDIDNAVNGTIELNGGVHEGFNTGAVGDASHAEGNRTVAAGDASHAEGYVETDNSRDHITGLVVVGNPTVDTVVDYKKIAFKKDSEYSGTVEAFASVGDVVFYKDIANGKVSYGKIKSIGQLAGTDDTFVYTLSHEVEVNVTDHPNSKKLFKVHIGAFGDSSHVEGTDTIANGDNSHAEGLGTIAKSANQHVSGKYNVADNNGDYAFIVGNGTADNARSNALGVKWNGDVIGSAIKSTIPSSGDDNKLPNIGAVRETLNKCVKKDDTTIKVKHYTGTSEGPAINLSTEFSYINGNVARFLVHNAKGSDDMYGSLFTATTGTISYGTSAGGGTTIGNGDSVLFTVYKTIVVLPPVQEGGEPTQVTYYLVKTEDKFSVTYED